jgi:hypothetical protein
MKKTKNFLAAIGLVAIVTTTILLTSAFTSPAPSSNGTLTYVTSRDGIKVYKIGDFIVVKTANSVSVSR